MENELVTRYEGIVETRRPYYHDFIKLGILEIGENTIIDEGVWLCHYNRDMVNLPVRIGKNCVIRAGSIIYGDVIIGDNCSFGHHVVVREGVNIGNYSSIGTHVTIELKTKIGNYTSIETGSHVTGFADIGNFVFWGAMVTSNNDFKMLYKRKGHGEKLKGPIVKDYARIGSGAMLMAGVEIGEGAVVNAHETVRKNIPAYTLFFTRQGKPIYKKIPQEEIIK